MAIPSQIFESALSPWSQNRIVRQILEVGNSLGSQKVSRGSMSIPNWKDQRRNVRTQAPIHIDSHTIRHSVPFNMVEHLAIGDITRLSVVLELPY